MVEIPKRPTQPSPEPEAIPGNTNGVTTEVTNDAVESGKRKRGDSCDELEQTSHDAKRLASAPVPDSKGVEAIVLDDEEEGAILIDD